MVFLFTSLFGISALASNNSMKELELKITDVAATGTISVEVDNTSSKPVRIWKESNSWGAARWRVLLIRGGRLRTLFQSPDQGFTRNVPGFEEIATGGHIEKKLDLNGGNWQGLDGTKISFEAGETIIVVYDVPKEFGWPDSSIAEKVRGMKVWYGVVAASTKFQ